MLPGQRHVPGPPHAASTRLRRNTHLGEKANSGPPRCFAKRVITHSPGFELAALSSVCGREHGGPPRVLGVDIIASSPAGHRSPEEAAWQRLGWRAREPRNPDGAGLTEPRPGARGEQPSGLRHLLPLSPGSGGVFPRTWFRLILPPPARGLAQGACPRSASFPRVLVGTASRSRGHRAAQAQDGVCTWPGSTRNSGGPNEARPLRGNFS